MENNFSKKVKDCFAFCDNPKIVHSYFFSALRQIIIEKVNQINLENKKYWADKEKLKSIFKNVKVEDLNLLFLNKNSDLFFQIAKCLKKIQPS